MKELLIAEASPYAMKRMMQLFADEWTIIPCCTSFEAVQALRQNAPEAVILSQCPPQVDCFEILAACFPDVPPTTVALTPSSLTADVRNLARWGVDTVFEQPCDLKMLKRNISVLHRSQSVTARRIAQHLRVLGLSAGSQGYVCLLLTICFFSDDLCQQLHNEVYHKVAEMTGTDERYIEKALRLIIRNGWERGDPEIWVKYFPMDKNGELACPKNKEFVTSLAQLV